jgi:ferredoxin
MIATYQDTVHSTTSTLSGTPCGGKRCTMCRVILRHAVMEKWNSASAAAFVGREIQARFK